MYSQADVCFPGGGLLAYLGTHDPGTQQEGKQQFVLLKEATADIAVEGVGKVLLDVGQPHCHSLTLGRSSYGAAKQVHKPGQRVLVHGIYVGKICNHNTQFSISCCMQ